MKRKLISGVVIAGLMVSSIGLFSFADDATAGASAPVTAVTATAGGATEQQPAVTTEVKKEAAVKSVSDRVDRLIKRFDPLVKKYGKYEALIVKNEEKLSSEVKQSERYVKLRGAVNVADIKAKIEAVKADAKLEGASISALKKRIAAIQREISKDMNAAKKLINIQKAAIKKAHIAEMKKKREAEAAASSAQAENSSDNGHNGRR